MKDNKFYKSWFDGISNFLTKESELHVLSFLSHCARSCSASYSKQIYLDNVKKDEPIKESLERLKNAFDDFSYELRDDRILVIYSKCGCNLVKDKLLKNPKLCLCSEMSLLDNWAEIFGKGNVKVKLIQSILCGNNKCEFEVKVRQLGHLKL